MLDWFFNLQFYQVKALGMLTLAFLYGCWCGITGRPLYRERRDPPPETPPEWPKPRRLPPPSDAKPPL